MSTIGLDADQNCSAVAPAAAAKGVAFCCRYLKNLSTAEVAALHAAGLKIVLIFETTGTAAVAPNPIAPLAPMPKLLLLPGKRALGGAANGTLNGARALYLAKQLGAPPGIAVAATVDFDATLVEQPTVLEYLVAFKAAAAGMKLMVYANGAICQAALDAGIADYTWLAGGLGMRGSRAFLASGRATIVQDVGDQRGLNLGIAIDTDIAASADYGAWAPSAQPIPSPPPPSPPLQRVLRLTTPPMTGDDVREVQTLLESFGYDVGGVDGVFGPNTESAIFEFQAVHNLVKDGICGSQTFAALESGG